MASATDSAYSCWSTLNSPPRVFLRVCASFPLERRTTSIPPSSRSSRANRNWAAGAPPISVSTPWTPSRPTDYVLGDKSGRKPQLFALWTVSAAETASGAKRDAALLVLATSGRLIRSGRLAGQVIREMQARLGKVPEIDENGVPSNDDRFQVKVGNTLLTWDGRQASDSAEASGSVEVAWAAADAGPGRGRGSLSLSPQWASPMVGSLKVEGKDDLAQGAQGLAAAVRRAFVSWGRGGSAAPAVIPSKPEEMGGNGPNSMSKMFIIRSSE